MYNDAEKCMIIQNDKHRNQSTKTVTNDLSLKFEIMEQMEDSSPKNIYF